MTELKDYRLAYDKSWLYHYHLEGKAHTVTIERVFKAKVKGEAGREAGKLGLKFREFDLPYAAPITVAHAIARKHGKDPTKWIGKKVVIYPTTTQFGAETRECIRVREGDGQ